MKGQQDAALLRAIDQQVERGRGNECWFWTGGMNGTIPNYRAPGAANVSVRRVLWQQAGGSLDGVDKLRSTCRRQRCVNPQHLRPSQACPVCHRPDRRAIEAALLEDYGRRGKVVAIAAFYGFEASGLELHRRGHMPVAQAQGTRNAIRVATVEAHQQAVAWLRDLLGNGPVPVHEVQRLAAEAGIKPSHLAYARRTLDVRRNFSGLDGGRPPAPRTGQPYRQAYRLPTEDEQREREEQARQVGAPLKTSADVEARLRLNFTRRQTRWCYLGTIKNWVGKPHHEAAVAAAEELHRRAWLDKLVDERGATLAYRYVNMASVIDPEGRNHMGAEPTVVVAKSPRNMVQPPPAQAVAQMADTIVDVLISRGRMSTNDLHNYLGSSRRGSAAVFNAALDKLVQDGRIRRTSVRNTNYYEVVPAANQQASA